jgi:hypothetical protein
MAVIDYGTARNGWDARTFKPGDILDASFHYSMKIPYFYIVTRTSKSSIWVRKLGRVVVSHDGYGQNGYMMPDLAERGDEEMGRIGKGGYLKLGGCTAHIWSGKPVDFYSD